MKQLLEQFRRTVLDPLRRYEDSLHPEGCTMFTCKHPWDARCKTAAEEMHSWEDYVTGIWDETVLNFAIAAEVQDYTMPSE